MNNQMKQVNTRLDKSDEGYSCVITNVKNAIFSGHGEKASTAVGDCIMSNRELLGFTFDIIKGDEERRSTEHGKPRSKPEDFGIYDIEVLQHHMNEIAKFNKLDLSKVKLREGGKEIPVTQEKLDEFKFVGLNNVSFVELRFWESEPIDLTDEIL